MGCDGLDQSQHYYFVLGPIINAQRLQRTRMRNPLTAAVPRTARMIVRHRTVCYPLNISDGPAHDSLIGTEQRVA
jgi:hypothetical protein